MLYDISSRRERGRETPKAARQGTARHEAKSPAVKNRHRVGTDRLRSTRAKTAQAAHAPKTGSTGEGNGGEKIGSRAHRAPADRPSRLPVRSDNSKASSFMADSTRTALGGRSQ